MFNPAFFSRALAEQQAGVGFISDLPVVARSTIAGGPERHD
jgi:hypothetical protein